MLRHEISHLMIDDVTIHAYLNADTASTVAMMGVVTAESNKALLYC